MNKREMKNVITHYAINGLLARYENETIAGQLNLIDLVLNLDADQKISTAMANRFENALSDAWDVSYRKVRDLK